MDNVKKLQFVHAMTAQALNHAKTTPNTMSPEGKMSHEKMAAFVAAQTKHGLQHFDAGGAVIGGPSATPTATTAAQTGGVGALGADAIPPGVSSEVGKIPVVGGAISSGLNPLGMLQGATQNNFTASAAPIQAGTNTDQLNNAYTQAQSGINQQQNLTNATAAGGNQGLATQSTLSGQLATEASGGGPNPAQAALNQNTGTNIEQQAALMAGQRGAGANAGLAAENAARQGATTQQQAVGQGATLSAEQQLAAQGAEANLAGTQVNQAGQAVTGLNTATQNEQNILQGANTAANNANVASTSNQNNVNAQVSEGNQAASNNLLGGIANGASSVVSSLFADGGEVTNLGSDNYTAPDDASSGPSVAAPSPVAQGDPFASSSGGGGGGSGGGGAGLMALAAMAKGGQVKLPMPKHLHAMATIFHPHIVGGHPMGDRLKAGGVVPGKAKVKGDSYSNDTVPAMLSPGEVVIDRATLARKDKIGKMARFIAQDLAKKPLRKKA